MLNSYFLQTISAIIRFIIWFILLFWIIAPFLFEEVQKLPKLNRLIFSWLSLGGVILLSVVFLTITHLYDIFSIVIAILIIPIIRVVWIHRSEGIFKFFEDVENKIIIAQIKFIEDFKGWRDFIKGLFHFGAKKEKDPNNEIRLKFHWQGWLLFVVVCISFIIRIYPVLIHAEPFTRGWFFNLHRVKEMRRQNYFDYTMNPGGLFAFISFLRFVTQISPEIILHMFGAFNNILLILIIFWGLRELMGKDEFWAPLFGAAIYGFLPVIFLPIQYSNQIEGSTIAFSLTFAIPTIIIFVKERASKINRVMFYVMAGIVATGLSSIFALFIFVLPAIAVTYIFHIKQFSFQKNWNDLLKIIAAIAIALLPSFIFIFVNSINVINAFERQLFLISGYTEFNNLILPIGYLCQYYIAIASVLLLVFSLLLIFFRKEAYLNIIVFIFVFMSTSYLYTPYTNIGYNYIDIDQLKLFYTILISSIFAIAFYALLVIFVKSLFSKKEFIKQGLSGLLFCGVIFVVFHYNNGIKIYNPQTQTLPGSFYKAYYRIINNNMDHTYSIVAPDIDTTMAMNRHGMMGYKYFMNQYTHTDSVYYAHYLENKSKKRGEKKRVLPNIFVFMENKPYDKIQPGILPHQQEVMRDMYSWIKSYKRKKYRRIKVYYRSHDFTVYKIINNPGRSSIYDILFNSKSEDHN